MKLKWITAPVVALLLLFSLTFFPAKDLLPPMSDPGADGSDQAGTLPSQPGQSGGGDIVLEETEVYTELGIPLLTKYPDGAQARCAWDMVLYDGNIYIGSGDYDKNRGPAEIWRYDITGGAFVHSGTVPDEEVNRFSLIFDTLVAPGIDPKEDWALGNYYVLTEGEWVKQRRLPGGVHCFDMVEYSGLIFAGMGVEDGTGYSPIAYSFDLDDSFYQVSLYKDGSVRDTAGYEYIRVYDFFVCGDELYALLFLFDSEGVRERCYELYHYDYDEDAFFFADDWTEKIKRLNYKNVHIGEKVIFDETLYFTTGYLYATNDMQTVTRIAFPQNAVVCDLYFANDTLYALTAAKDAESGKLKTTVYALSTGETEFCEVTSFLYDIPPMSMVVEGDDLYISMGNGNAAHAKNGMLLRVSLAEK